jgi:DNA (cytosine-5)-methyltransferase 1
MDRPLLYDICCCAGGASKGYQNAGFRVIGIDNKPQPHYIGDGFILMDCLEFLDRYLAGEFERADAFHASPPCQEYSMLKSLKSKSFPKLVEPIRERLIATGKPYAIENVVGAPLINPLVLCGTMFDLRVQRHRLFETNPEIYFLPFSCNHWGRTQPRNDKRGESKVACLEKYPFLTVTGHDFRNRDGSKAMGIDWMNNHELAEAIPPAYTEFIGKYLMQIIRQEVTK